jgi:hypothetical protein
VATEVHSESHRLFSQDLGPKLGPGQNVFVPLDVTHKLKQAAGYLTRMHQRPQTLSTEELAKSYRMSVVKLLEQDYPKPVKSHRQNHTQRRDHDAGFQEIHRAKLQLRVLKLTFFTSPSTFFSTRSYQGFPDRHSVR